MGSSRFARKVAIGLLVGATAVGLSVSAGAASAAPAAPQTRHPLTGSTPKWLPFARDMGTTVSTDPVTFGVLLSMRNASGAEATLKAVSDPSSASYGHYLTNKQFDARYAPAASSVAAVRNWLRDQGFTVTKTLPSGMYVRSTGRSARWRPPSDRRSTTTRTSGKQVYANTSQLSLPAGTPTAVSGAISGIVGDRPGLRAEVSPPTRCLGRRLAPGSGSSRARRTTGRRSPPPSRPPTASTSRTRSAVTRRHSCSRRTGRARCSSRASTDAGYTVAITDAYAAPTMLADAQKYNQVHGQPLFKAGQYSQITPDPNGYADEDLCGPQGWYGEESSRRRGRARDGARREGHLRRGL